MLCGCVTLSVDPRAVVFTPGSDPRITSLKCDDVARVLQGAADSDTAKSLDGKPFRLLIWNIHKEGDAGWQQDLAALAGESDLVLLQETVLQASLRDILGDAGFSWVMASSFVYDARRRRRPDRDAHRARWRVARRARWSRGSGFPNRP